MVKGCPSELRGVVLALSQVKFLILGLRLSSNKWMRLGCVTKNYESDDL